MAADKTKQEQKKISLNEDTYQKLKTYTRANGVKLRLVIDAMTDKLLQDEEFAAQIIAAATQKQQPDS